LTKPPPQLDTAQVLYWVWAGDEPFRRVPNREDTTLIEIFGYAVCFLEGTIYRFACDQNWDVHHDSDFSSIQEAMDSTIEQYPDRQIRWEKYDDTNVERLTADSRPVRYYQETGERRVIQRMLEHMTRRGCGGMSVQLVGENAWELSIWMKDVETAQEFISSNID